MQEWSEDIERRARVEALRKLMDEFFIVMPATGHQHSATNTEDLEPYLTGEVTINGPFAAVTVGHVDSGGAITYIDPGYERAEDAGEKATRNVDDGIYPEWPVAVVNLDTGERLLPQITWGTTDSPLPAPPEHLADAWERYQEGGGGGVTSSELRALDEWRGDCAEEAGF